MLSDRILTQLSEQIAKKSKRPPAEIRQQWETPGKTIDADFALPCFRLATLLNEKPNELATGFQNSLTPPKGVTRLFAQGPFLNVLLSPGELAEDLFALLKTKTPFGHSSLLKKERYLLEHTSMNPSGPVHIGRVRNSFIGDTLKRLLKSQGADVETHYFVNDVGKQIAIIATAKKEKIPPSARLKKKYKQYANRPDFLTFFQYVPGNEKAEKNKTFQAKVTKLIEAAESGDAGALNQLKKTAAFCLEGQKASLTRFDITFDTFDFESKYLEDGSAHELMTKLEENEYATVKDGAFGLDLSSFGLERRSGLTVLKRKNGTTVYLARDLAYHQEKLRRANHLITVLGEDHKVEFNELSTILRTLTVLNEKNSLEMVNLSFVTITGHKLSTRKGNTLSLDEIVDEGVIRALYLIERRNPDLPVKEKTELAERIAIAAIRYAELKVSPNKSIIFDWERALSFEGDTGPYLQYALVRAKNILNKTGTGNKPNKEQIDAPEEKALILKLLRFPGRVTTATKKRAPHVLTNYLYELSTLFSSFYENCPVVNAPATKKSARIKIVESFTHVMITGMHLLGIPDVDRM